ncbi:hypothetical protein VKT23_005714 [Stygiomarasmius scandens]|uniref:Protein kinase domain-containing protein n=1 Tax=Marasmiellus scandens TaxID=2682957 RepID=A0ABR1JTQ9_9AGAR
MDRNSQFFKQLTAPVAAATPSQSLQWPTTMAPHPAHSIDISSISINTNTKCSEAHAALHQDSQESDEPRKTILLNKHSFETLYSPSGKWEWINNLPLLEKESTFLSDGAMCNAYIKNGEIGSKAITYVCKSWKTSSDWNNGFYLEVEFPIHFLAIISDQNTVQMGLYKTHLRSLQGIVVPYIISLFTAPGFINVIMEPPHHSFWMEASTDMPLVLKQRCVEAFEKLHACGVLHGDVELRHMLIGGDARVTLIDFQESRALVPVPQVGLRQVHEGELRRELRKVKVKLDYPGAREREYARFERYSARRSKGEPDLLEDITDPPVKSLQEWNNWIAAPQKPNRFLVPGQAAGTVFGEIQTFLKLVESTSLRARTEDRSRDLLSSCTINDTRNVSQTTISSSPSVHTLSSDIGINITDSDTGLPTDHFRSGEDNSGIARASDLSPQHSAQTSTESPSVNPNWNHKHSPRLSTVALGKRRAETNIDSESPPPKRRILDSLPTNISVGRQPTPSESNDVIGMKNLADCIANQLPHPTLLELFPNNPRWKQPDVQYYLKEQAREIQRTVNAAKYQPDRRFRLPRPIRSFGPLKRKMDEIRSIIQIRAVTGPTFSIVGSHEDGDMVGEGTTIQSNQVNLDPVNPLQSDTTWYRYSIRWIRNVVGMWV